MKVPNSWEDWQKIAKEFEDKWNFPNCIGAMDGKHIAIQCPLKSGSNYYNYKQFYSIVLLALVDADYKFIYVDCGCNGRVSDGGVFANSSLYQALESNDLNIPPKKPLPLRHTPVPYVTVGDEAFPLKSYIMKPYSFKNLDQNKRIFNYRLSRARRIVENVFGILTSRFGVFKKAIPLEPEKVEGIVLACCALHNFLRTRKSATEYIGPGMIDEEDTENGTMNYGIWRHEMGTNLPGLIRQCGNRSSNDVREIREEFCDYFNTNGQVSWQWELL
ncbi:uncharacterized protein LOC134237799 [Saccostrea cucullata]|uniref:uncharacterized protein LOC134237799 n=1 Tax=Saccostrea cuccullata TaxID=36930 RepID=UPI002ED53EAB